MSQGLAKQSQVDACRSADLPFAVTLAGEQHGGDQRDDHRASAHHLDQAVASAVSLAIARAQVGKQAALSVDRARGLENIAHVLLSHKQNVLTTAADETHLTIAELEPEFERMVLTLRMFAAVVRTRFTRKATRDESTFDPSETQSSPFNGGGPKHNLELVELPIGIVAVFGSSNFPLAYGALGGDVASAIAAGCPVIVKEHPAHPKTGRLLASLASSALASVHEAAITLHSYLREQEVGDVNPGSQTGRALADHPSIAAIGFTGSTRVGMQLVELCAKRQVPIPAFCEMGSVNPVLIADRAITAPTDARQLADQLATSILTRHGQQCTKPGVIFLDCASTHSQVFLDQLVHRFMHAPARLMLSRAIAQQYRAGLKALAALPGVHLLIAEAQTAQNSTRDHQQQATFPAIVRLVNLESRELKSQIAHELFGPAVVVVDCPQQEMLRAVSHLPGALTLTVCDDDASALFSEIQTALAIGQIPRPGRLIVNGVPTGVRVAYAMHHGGPWPAASATWWTAVGPRAIDRFLVPMTLQGQAISRWPKTPGENFARGTDR